MIDIEKVLLNLDLPLTAQRGDEVQGLCPMHKARTGNDDHNPSWWINIETGAHMCFSCGYKGNIYTLVSDVKGLDYFDAKDFVVEQEIPVDTLLKRIRDLPQYVEPEYVEMSEARLAVFVDPPEHILETRKITAEAAQKCGVLWDPKTLSWILPIRDPNTGALWGWQEKGAFDRYFRNYPGGIKKSKTVFNVQNLNRSQVIVVESPLDVVRLETVGYTGAISTYGAFPSKEQARIIANSDLVIAAFDKDEAGQYASEMMLKYSRQYGVELKFFNYRGIKAKDPGDMTEKQIHWGIEHSVDRIHGKEAYAWT
jgi:5S rRNA maturation endonuclease (ribonuclease M5)